MTTAKKSGALLLALLLLLSLMPGSFASAEEPNADVNRFNVVLVIDKSGSLRDANGQGTDPDGLRFDAMRLFLGLLTERGNNVGAVVFDQEIRYDSGVRKMDGMEDKKDLIREAEAFTPAYDTDIGSAVLRATQMLQGMREENDLPCMILLLTDGKTDFTTEAGQEKKQASWAVAQQALDAAKEAHITISGILLNVDGKGDGGRWEFQAYTQGTGGSFVEVSRPEDLAGAFRLAFSNEGRAEFFFTVPSFGVEEVNVIVEHDTAPDERTLDTLVGVEILQPDGSRYDDAEHALLSTRYILVKIPAPAVGEWQVRLVGEPEDWVDVTMVYNASMSVSLDGDRPSGAYRAYSPYTFTASVTDPGVGQIAQEELQNLRAVLAVENLATGDVREYAMTAGENAYTSEISFLKGGDYALTAEVGIGGFKVRSAPMAVTVEPWPLVAKVSRITDILQYGRFVGDCWELELGDLFGVTDTSGIRYSLSDDCGGILSIEDGVLRARFGVNEEVSFVLTASDLMGQSAVISFDLKIPHVTATTERVNSLLSQGRLGDHRWEMEVDELFADPKGCPLTLALSDDYEGRVTLTDGLLEMDLRELREAAFTVSATDIFGVRFMPGTHPAGLSLKLHDLIGLRLPLRDCLPESFDFDGLARQKTFVTRVRFFLKEYAKLYHLQKEPDPFGKEALFDAVCELIYQTDGQIRISELSEHTSYTDRYIRKVFQEEMGFPPKTFCNILRFQRAIEFINYGYEEKTADWMTALGYYDQAQCVRDFRKYLGMTPNRYRKLVRASSYEQRATYAHDLGLRI